MRAPGQQAYGKEREAGCWWEGPSFVAKGDKSK
jgi:hypothetical protein